MVRALALLVALTAAPALAADRAAPGARPSVVVWMVDTLRADALGCYGADAEATPSFDALASAATVFETARAQSSFTKTAVASLFTGLYPPTHGVLDRPELLDARHVTLAERLSAAGYQTAGFVTIATVQARFGYGRGFDRYVEMPTMDAPHLHARAGTPVDAALRWLDERDPRRPFLLYVHSSDPHGPYVPRRGLRDRFAPGVSLLDAATMVTPPGAEAETWSEERLADFVADARALYAAEVANVDRELGRFGAALVERGLFDDTLFVVIADHGEEFHEHGGWTHGGTLYEEVLRIPLIVRFPGGSGAGARVEAPVEQVDVLPTVLAAAGLPADPALPGHDLAALLREPRARPPRTVAQLGLGGRRLRALTLDPWKLIVRDAGPVVPERSWLFDLGRDPGERRDWSASDPEQLARMRVELDSTFDALVSAGPAPRLELDAELLRQLEALGYVDADEERP